LAEAWADAATWQKIEHKSPSTLDTVDYFLPDVDWAPDSSAFALCDHTHDMPKFLVDVAHPDTPVEIDVWGYGDNVYWSPDSQYFMALRMKSLETDRLMLFSRNGKDLSLPSLEDIFFIAIESLKVSLQWLPNSHHLLCGQAKAYNGGWIADIVDYDVGTGEKKVLLKNVDFDGFRVGLAPDGKNLILYSGNDIIETQKAGEIRPKTKKWLRHCWHLDMETKELNELTYCDWQHWTADSRHLYGYQNLETDGSKLLIGDERGRIEAIYPLPTEVFNKVDETYLELDGDYLYYHHRVWNPEEQEPLVRYNLKTRELAKLIAPRKGWLMDVMDRKGDRWLVQYWKEDDRRNVLEREYVLYEVKE